MKAGDTNDLKFGFEVVRLEKEKDGSQKALRPASSKQHVLRSLLEAAFVQEALWQVPAKSLPTLEFRYCARDRFGVQLFFVRNEEPLLFHDGLGDMFPILRPEI